MLLKNLSKYKLYNYQILYIRVINIISIGKILYEEHLWNVYNGSQIYILSKYNKKIVI